jgi:hypothetical protein
MADRDRDDKTEAEDRQAIGGQQSHRSEYGDQADQTDSAMSHQGREGSFGGESSGGGMGGQPIGGNDSNTGSGTTLTAGYTPPPEDEFAVDAPGEEGDEAPE